MHPTYVSDKPGECPICGMKFVLIKQDVEPGQKQPGAAAVPGRAIISVPADKQQLIGVRFSLVTNRELNQTIRTTAFVAHDETRQAKISPRFAGWVRKLYVNYTGQHVEKGEPLLTVYSPELLAAEGEYLLAFRRFAQVKDKADDPQRESARVLMESARRRLALWEIGDEEIAELERSSQPKDEILLRSPVSGHVLTKGVVEGKSFMAGDTLYAIEDLSRVWLRTSIFESDFPLVRVGQKAHITFPSLGTMVWDTEVTFIDPHMDPVTRRGEVRLELNNPGHRFRPDMWANVEMEVPLGEVLAVPASAVIDTGTRSLVFVKGDGNHFEPRELKIGARTDEYLAVEEGLVAGQFVVTRALFLIDSESQLKAAIAGMAGEHKH
jgi:Cu(I)/Ag(I) efflux system membrane fusion protein